MMNAIMQQVSEQDVPTTSYEPSHKNDPAVSHRHNEGRREAPQANRDRRSQEENRDRSIGANAHHSHRPSYGQPVKSTMALMPHATHCGRTAWFEEQEQTSRPQGKSLNVDGPQCIVRTVNACEVPRDVPTTSYEPSHRNDPAVSHRHNEGRGEAPQANRDRRSREENRDRSIGANAHHSHRPSHGQPVKSTMALMPHATHSGRTAWFEEQEQTSRPQGKSVNVDGPQCTWRPRVLRDLFLASSTCLPRVGTIPRCLIATTRGGERLPNLTETDGYGKRTETVLLGPTPMIVTIQAMDSCPLRPRCRMQHTPDEPPGSRSRSRPRGLKHPYGGEGSSYAEEVTLMTSASKPHNAWKYYEFHEQNGHTTVECRELRKALHELADKGQIDRFLKRGLRFLRKECEPTQSEPRDEECSTKIVATIAGGYAEGITWSTWKARLRGTQ
ncbi:LOW QUALITY PROTEIN: hypothetical protein Cgig2_006527 [Carnegiea gigantea]|uniref:Uncharacterized protein n=1 Tax=Carnegiea gigantea TaxID=171969 RepID=A0A9Q1GWR0_9CARY|nr:LOW QUALITY PROTEIN: hypothetical protein Cgig2_006527 [Carnegiea gigantea]